MSSNEKPSQKYKSVHVGSLAEEFAKNDDIVDYIHGNSLEQLKAKYGVAEEDEKIRRTPFSSRSSQNGDHTHSTEPREARHDTIETPIAPIKTKFQATTSRYDNDRVMFGDIKLEEKKTEAEPEKKPAKRGRPPKKKEVTEAPASMTEKYNTNTKVVFVNNEVDDGIKRTDELEVSSAFTADNKKKHKTFFKRRGDRNG